MLEQTVTLEEDISVEDEKQTGVFEREKLLSLNNCSCGSVWYPRTTIHFAIPCLMSNGRWQYSCYCVYFLYLSTNLIAYVTSDAVTEFTVVTLCRQQLSHMLIFVG